MTAELRAQLTELLDEAELDWLKPQLQKDAVVIVHTGLDLVDVGVAIAQDDSLVVDRWISEQLITKPNHEHLAKWHLNPQQKFRAIIVQPYVLVQEIPLS
jgi:hypothetical protein